MTRLVLLFDPPILCDVATINYWKGHKSCQGKIMPLFLSVMWNKMELYWRITAKNLYTLKAIKKPVIADWKNLQPKKILTLNLSAS